MARVLINVAEGMGHVNPALAVAARLIERGHEVWFLTGSEYAERVEAIGAHFISMEELGWTPPPFSELFPPVRKPQSRRTRLNPLGLLLRIARRIDRSFNRARWTTFINSIFAANTQFESTVIWPMPYQLLQYRHILERFPADVVLVDVYCLGAMALNELGGPPWASLGVTAMLPSSPDTPPFNSGLPPATSGRQRALYRLMHWLGGDVAYRPALRALNRERARLGLAPLPPGKALMDWFFSPFLHIQGTTVDYEFPNRYLPQQVHLVGPLLPVVKAEFTPPAWWPDLDSARAVVLVTQGTLRTAAGNLVLPTLRAMSNEDVLVVSATPEIEALGPLPPNARVESFIPYEAMLPHVDVLVTNGGYLGVQQALAHGVPMVVAGMTEDKCDIGVRIAWLGAGINLLTDTPTPEQIGEAVRTVLRDPTYRNRARSLQDVFARYDGPSTAAALIEELAATGRPVMRDGVRAPAQP